MEAFGAVSSLAIFIGVLLLAILGILLPVSAYSAQKYAFLCLKELQVMNGHLRALIDEQAKGPKPRL